MEDRHPADDVERTVAASRSASSVRKPFQLPWRAFGRLMQANDKIAEFVLDVVKRWDAGCGHVGDPDRRHAFVRQGIQSMAV